MRLFRPRVPGWCLLYKSSQGQCRNREPPSWATCRNRGLPSGADPPGLSRQFGYVLSLSVFYCDYTRRVYNRAGPWAFGFGIRLSLLSLCLLVTLGRLSPQSSNVERCMPYPVVLGSDLCLDHPIVMTRHVALTGSYSITEI